MKESAIKYIRSELEKAKDAMKHNASSTAILILISVLEYLAEEKEQDVEKDIKKETDWSKVSVDTKVRIKNSASGNRFFAKYEDGRVCLWDNGRTSWSAYYNADTSLWSPDEVELVEEDKNGRD